jgi:hypothetical protein
VNVETKEHSKQWMHIHQTSQKNLNTYLPARWQLFFGDRKDEIHAAREHNNTKILHKAIQNKRCGMPISSVVLLDNACPHTAACM